jgi:hypothetical protein
VCFTGFGGTGGAADTGDVFVAESALCIGAGVGLVAAGAGAGLLVTGVDSLVALMKIPPWWLGTTAFSSIISIQTVYSPIFFKNLK